MGKALRVNYKGEVICVTNGDEKITGSLPWQQQFSWAQRYSHVLRGRERPANKQVFKWTVSPFLSPVWQRRLCELGMRMKEWHSWRATVAHTHRTEKKKRKKDIRWPTQGWGVWASAGCWSEWAALLSGCWTHWEPPGSSSRPRWQEWLRERQNME